MSDDAGPDCPARAPSACPGHEHRRYCTLAGCGRAGPGAEPSAKVRAQYRAKLAGSADEPPLPSPLRRAANLARATADHVAHGLPTADEATVAARLEQCRSCPSFRASDKVCSDSRCGCFVEVKATWARQKCPLGKWPG